MLVVKIGEMDVGHLGELLALLKKASCPLQHHHHHHLRRVCGARSQGGGQGGTMDREGEQAGTRSRGLSALAATGIAYAHNFLRRTVLG